MEKNETYYGYEKMFTKEDAINLLFDKLKLLYNEIYVFR